MHVKGARGLFLSLFFLIIVGVTTARTDTLAPTGAPVYVPVVVRGYPCYAVETLVVGQATEYHLKCTDQHFLTVIHEYGLVILRPHPGRDVNGWGSSWYAQPYLRDTSSAHSIIESVTTYPNRIRISTSGRVSIGSVGDYGTWRMTLDLVYDSIERKVSGAGTYHITLDGALAEVGDLKLYKIASNYLIDVPLLSGGRGNTGDMSEVIINRDNSYDEHWIPTRGDHCPQNVAHKLSLHVLGQYNNVDTAAQGHPPIEPAYKPGLKVVLDDTRPADAGMIFCGFYNSGLSHAFWTDNVATHAIIRADTAQTEFDYDVTFESRAAADECSRPSTCQP